MDDPGILTLVGVGIAVVAIATYLIIIAMILQRVVNRLVIILGGVGDSTQRSEPVGAVIDDINRDLDASRVTLEACVERLVQRHGAPNGDTELQGIAMGNKRPVVRTGYSAASAAADETITKRANLRRGNTAEPAVSEGAISDPPETGGRGPGAHDDDPRGGGGTGGRRWWNR
ncbi:MAG: hypothetical protein M3Z33_01890 [Actinomycetota bacterium]|nr:hypothetical protein [Actinomycetota bacterium]